MREQELLIQLGNRIKTLRKGAGLSQEQLGDKVGLAYESVSKLERGLNFTGLGTLFQISKALDCSLPDLFSWAPKRKLTADEEQLERSIDRLRSLHQSDEAPSADDIEELIRLINRKKRRKL
jgi:transcriptional regulator with XRE-family HTH domain